MGKRYLLSFDKDDKVNGWYTKFPNPVIRFILGKTTNEIRQLENIKVIDNDFSNPMSKSR